MCVCVREREKRERERERERKKKRERERERERERAPSQEFICRVSNFPISDMVNVTRSTTAQFCFDILLVTKFIAALIIPLPFACRRLRTELPTDNQRSPHRSTGRRRSCVCSLQRAGPLAPFHSPLENFGIT